MLFYKLLFLCLLLEWHVLCFMIIENVKKPPRFFTFLPPSIFERLIGALFFISFQNQPFKIDDVYEYREDTTELLMHSQGGFFMHGGGMVAISC